MLGRMTSTAVSAKQDGGLVQEDVTGWAAIDREVGGADENKYWLGPDLQTPRHEQWLWKPRKVHGRHPHLNDVAEVVASRLAATLGLPAAECRYAIRGAEVGVISKNVTPAGYALHDGGTFLEEVDGYKRHALAPDKEGRVRGRQNIDEGYTLEAVQQVLDGTYGPPGYEDSPGLAVFAGYLVLDALIANTDRHPRNWALLSRESDGRRLLAPTFDHGTALGSGLDDSRRATRDVSAFCRKGRARTFTPPESLVQLAARAVSMSGATRWLDRVDALATSVIRGALEVPGGRLSEAASTFMESVLIENQRRLRHVDRDQD